MSIDAKTLDELERLEKAATPGPWDGKDGLRLWARANGGKLLADMKYTDANGDDPEFVATLRNAAPALIAAAREVVELREAVRVLAVGYAHWTAFVECHKTPFPGPVVHDAVLANPLAAAAIAQGRGGAL